MSKQTKRLRVLVEIMRVLVVLSVVAIFFTAGGIVETGDVPLFDGIIRMICLSGVTVVLVRWELTLTYYLKKNIRRDRLNQRSK